MIEGKCDQCGYPLDIHGHISNYDDGTWTWDTCDEAARRVEFLSDRLARSFKYWLEKKHPEYRWVRVHRPRSQEESTTRKEMSDDSTDVSLREGRPAGARADRAVP